MSKLTPRQRFANWRKSSVGQEIIRDKKRHQLWMCPSCMKDLPNNFHVHHLYPIAMIKDDNDERVFHHDNLVLLCGSCNQKQGSKVDERFD